MRCRFPGLAIVVFAFLAQPAAGQENLAVCNGTATETYSPALTYTTQEIDYTGDVAFTCSVHPEGVNGGGLHVEGTFDLSCATVGMFPQQLTIVWSDDSESEVLLTAVQVTPGLLTQVTTGQGSVLDGRFEGAAVVATATYLNVSLAGCATGGISQLSGLFVLTVIDS